MTKHIVVTGIAVMILTLVGAVAPLCADEKDWTLVGTWINPEYEGAGVQKLPKIALTADGAITQYYHVEGSLPWSVGKYVVESDWTEPGVHWFKLRTAFSVWTFYEIARLTENGTVYESVISSQAYPASFDPSSKDSAYLVRRRLE